MLGQRLDKWLWCARLVKTRTLAARLIEAGKIRINGERTLKVSRPVRAGDVVTGVSARAGRLFVVRVAGEAERRGPVTVARTLYEDLTPRRPLHLPTSREAGHVPPSATAGGSTLSRPTMHSSDCVLRRSRSLQYPGLARPAPLGMACLVLGARLG